MTLTINNTDKYRELFNADLGFFMGATYTKYYETEQNKKELEQYKKDYKNAENTMTKEEFDEWEWKTDPPVMPSETRDIPHNEDWDIVNKLIEESIKQNKDLLWERYKDNIIPDTSDIVL